MKTLDISVYLSKKILKHLKNIIFIFYYTGIFGLKRKKKMFRRNYIYIFKEMRRWITLNFSRSANVKCLIFFSQIGNLKLKSINKRKIMLVIHFNDFIYKIKF